MNPIFQKAAVALIVLSFTFCVFVIVLVNGLENTPYSTRDSAGRAMGFNDRLSREHYALALSNFSARDLLNIEYVYCLLLLAMHFRGLQILLRPQAIANIRKFFLAQGLIFPLGWIGIFFLPLFIRSVIRGTLDREGIIDIPFIAITTHPIWIATAMFIVFVLKRRVFKIAVSARQ